MTKSDSHCSPFLIEPGLHKLASAKDGLCGASAAPDTRIESNSRCEVGSNAAHVAVAPAAAAHVVASAMPLAPAFVGTFGGGTTPGCFPAPHTETPALQPTDHLSLQPADRIGKYFVYSLADPGAAAPYFMRMASGWGHILNMQAKTAHGPNSVRIWGNGEVGAADELPILRIWGVFDDHGVALQALRRLRRNCGLNGSLARKSEQRRLRGDYVTYALCENDIHHPYYVGQTEHLTARSQSHMHRENTGVKVYRRRLAILERGGQVVTRVLDRSTNRADSLASELHWIKQLSAEGHLLMNCHKMPRKPKVPRQVSSEIEQIVSRVSESPAVWA